MIPFSSFTFLEICYTFAYFVARFSSLSTFRELFFCVSGPLFLCFGSSFSVFRVLFFRRVLLSSLSSPLSVPFGSVPRSSTMAVLSRSAPRSAGAVLSAPRK